MFLSYCIFSVSFPLSKNHGLLNKPDVFSRFISTTLFFQTLSYCSEFSFFFLLLLLCVVFSCLPTSLSCLRGKSSKLVSCFEVSPPDAFLKTHLVLFSKQGSWKHTLHPSLQENRLFFFAFRLVCVAGSRLVRFSACFLLVLSIL